MSVLVRHAGNPVLAAGDLPYPSSLVFNAGVTKYRNRYVMVFRNDVGFFEDHQEQPHTNLGIAFSDDGVKWDVQPRPWLSAAELGDEYIRFYDPRLTVIDGRCYLCFAVDTRYGVRGGIAVTDDFSKVEILSLSIPDDRNMVLFPDRIGGDFVRLERPFPVYSRGDGEKFDIWLSRSADCRSWGGSAIVLGAEEVPFANSKIGPAAPPIRTSRGYLTTFHATWKDMNRKLYCYESNRGVSWHKEYLAGLMLLDLADPTKVIGLAPEPLLKAETEYELKGFRGSVIFPGGMILEDSGEVKIYYGAADTVECLASAHVDDLLSLCRPLASFHQDINGITLRCDC